MKTINQLIRENLHKPICVNLDPDDVSVAGQKAIVKYLQRNSIFCPDYTFDWRIRTDRGTLGKRISSYHYKNYNEKVDSSHIENINNIANKHRAYFDTFYLKFDDGLFWRLGEFNDGDSCYWLSKDYMRAKLNGSMRVYAVKLYRDMMFDRTFGRAILIMDCPDDNSLICINSYPKGFQVTNIGRLLVKFSSMNEIKTMTKYVEVTYRSSWKDYIWINGGNGAIVSSYEENRVFPDRIDMYESGVVFEKCSMCKRETTNLSTVNKSIGVVCIYCASKIIQCQHCNKIDLKSRMNMISPRSGYYICDQCYSKTVACESCGERFLPLFSAEKIYTSDLYTAATVPRHQCSYVPIYGFTCRNCAGDIMATIRQADDPVRFGISIMSDVGLISSYYKGRENKYGRRIYGILSSLNKVEGIIRDGNEPKT